MVGHQTGRSFSEEWLYQKTTSEMFASVLGKSVARRKAQVSLCMESLAVSTQELANGRGDQVPEQIKPANIFYGNLKNAHVLLT